MGQIAKHRPSKRVPLKILIDLTTLEKCGKFLHLSNPTKTEPDPWVRILNGKRGLHLVLYLVYGEWRVPWSFRVWRGNPSPSDLACKLLGTVPKQLTLGWRALEVKQDSQTIIWFWIGSHGEYDNLLKEL